MKERFTNACDTAETIIKECDNLSADDGMYFRALAENCFVTPYRKYGTYEDLEYIFEQAKNFVRYTHDPNCAEFLKLPSAIKEDIEKQGYLIGDCDDIALFGCLILNMLGYQTGVKIIEINNEGDFCHIYPVIWINNKFIAFDLTVNQPMNWETTDITYQKIFI